MLVLPMLDEPPGLRGPVEEPRFVSRPLVDLGPDEWVVAPVMEDIKGDTFPVTRELSIRSSASSRILRR